MRLSKKSKTLNVPKINIFKRKKIILGIVIITTSTIAWAYCPPQYQEQWVSPSFLAATQSVKAAMTAVDVELSALLKTNNERLVSAIAVMTKQKALSANQTSDSIKNASQQTAEGLNILAQVKRVKEARLQYGGEFGQGFSPCVVSEKRYTTYIQSSQNDQILRETINNEVYAAPGKYSETAVKAKQQLLEDHQNYCTQSQVDSGLCKSVGKKPGMDLNAATLFTLSDSDGDTYKAKVAFVNNIVGAADPMIPKSQAKTPAAQNYVLMKSQNDALISPAITTLKSIQLDFSGANSVEGGKGTPVAKQFQDEVKRYAGNSPEHTQWSKVLSAQTERGLLVEQLKMKALDLSLSGKKYREYERMEAQLASLVALRLKNGGFSASVRKTGLQAEQNEIKRKTN